MSPLHNVLNDLLTQIDKFSFIDLNKNVYDIIMFSMLKKEVKFQFNKEKSNKNYDIDFKKEMSISNTSPYLPAIDQKFTYSLILDLDETLVHYFYVQLLLM